MIVRLFPSDQTGCGFSRMIAPGNCVADQTDIEVQWVFDQEDEGGLEVNTAGRIGMDRVVSVKDPQCDVIVMQRPAHRHLIESIPHIQAWGTAVVCDYDDDFNSIDPRNRAFAAYEPGRSPMMNKVWAQLGSQLADLVTVTTPALAKTYGAGGRARILPNYVPESYLSVRPSWIGTWVESTGDFLPPRIGWAGSPQSHPGDLEVMGSSIAHLVGDGKAVFRTVGSPQTVDIVGGPVARRPGLSFDRDEAEILGWVPLPAFMAQVASFDIGVVPLRDSRFNRAKSWLKGLEYAALGVPFVASPLAEYKRLSALGCGDLVSTTTRNTESWQRAIQRLCEDAEYRHLRAEEGRIQARAMTYELHASEWAQAWTDALSIRRAR